MHTRYLCKTLASFVLVLGLAACASNVNRQQGASNWQYQGQKFYGLQVNLNDEAKEKLKDNIKFDAQRLQQTVQRALEARGLMDKTSTYSLAVEVKDIRVRSTFSAVMWGFMAGSDHVVGDVSLRSPTGKPIHTFEVSASYALGGIGGGQDESRMNWLYEEFAKLTVNEILNGDGPKVATSDR